jgi:hypothetical protein
MLATEPHDYLVAALDAWVVGGRLTRIERGRIGARIERGVAAAHQEQ